MYRDETWDEPVTLKRGDLFVLISCAMAYDRRLPYGGGRDDTLRGATDARDEC